MEDFQYAHLETFACQLHPKKKAHQFTITGALGEAMRIERYCHHLSHPLPPTLLHGSEQGVRRVVSRWYAETRDAIGRRLQKTAIAMIGAIFSFPREKSEQDQAAYERWREKTKAWLLKKYGKCLRLLVEHLDESNPHLHALLVPEPGEPISTIHPGARMWEQMDLDRQHRGAGRKAVERAGFVDWQNDYFEQVSQAFGLKRCQTPDKKRKHVPTREYRAQQLEAVWGEALCRGEGNQGAENAKQREESIVGFEAVLTTPERREQGRGPAPVNVACVPTKTGMAEAGPNDWAEFFARKMQEAKSKKPDPDEGMGEIYLESSPGS